MFKKAERKRVKLRLALEGPSGSGKTHSAILIARGLVGPEGKIAVLDTENESASLYAHLTEFDTATMAAPYEPERFIKAIKGAEQAGYDCLVIDSISHEWNGKGGCLEIHGGMTGNSFTNWGKVTPRHDAFMQSMLQSSMHIIATMRSKETYTLVDGNNGKPKPEKAGEAPLQRQGVAYEFTTVLTMNIKHKAESTKDRTGLFPADYTFTPSEDTGQALAEWLNSGKDTPPAPPANRPPQLPPADMDRYRREFPACSTMDAVVALFESRKGKHFTDDETKEFIVLKDAAKGRIAFVGDTTPPQANDDGPITAGQRTWLQTHYNGWDRAARLFDMSNGIGVEVTSFNDLSSVQAHAAIEAIQAGNMGQRGAA